MTKIKNESFQDKLLSAIKIKRVEIASSIMSEEVADTHDLVHENGKKLKIGDVVKDFRGDKHKITGWSAPRHAGTSGRVHTDQGSYYPSVIDARLVDKETGRYFGDGKDLDEGYKKSAEKYAKSIGHEIVSSMLSASGKKLQITTKDKNGKTHLHNVPRDSEKLKESTDAMGNGVASHELVLYADNHAGLHKQSHTPIMANLAKKVAKGIYDHEKAKILWGYHADRAAMAYHKEFGDKNQKWHELFSKDDRRKAAAEFADNAKDELSTQHESVNEVKAMRISSKPNTTSVSVVVNKLYNLAYEKIGKKKKWANRDYDRTFDAEVENEYLKSLKKSN